MNIVVNAVEATPSGGEVLVRRLRIRPRNAGCESAIRVRNSGNDPEENVPTVLHDQIRRLRHRLGRRVSQSSTARRRHPRQNRNRKRNDIRVGSPGNANGGGWPAHEMYAVYVLCLTAALALTDVGSGGSPRRNGARACSAPVQVPRAADATRPRHRQKTPAKRKRTTSAPRAAQPAAIPPKAAETKNSTATPPTEQPQHLGRILSAEEKAEYRRLMNAALRPPGDAQNSGGRQLPPDTSDSFGRIRSFSRKRRKLLRLTCPRPRSLRIGPRFSLAIWSGCSIYRAHIATAAPVGKSGSIPPECGPDASRWQRRLRLPLRLRRLLR